jgi:hypothetical protein
MSSNEDNELIQIEETEVVAPVKKPKRQMSDAQLASLAKGRATRIANAKTKSLGKDVTRRSPPIVKPPPEEVPPPPPKIKKERKQKIVYVDTESESEEEIVYKKRPKSKITVEMAPPPTLHSPTPTPLFRLRRV